MLSLHKCIAKLIVLYYILVVNSKMTVEKKNFGAVNSGGNSESEACVSERHEVS